MYNAHGNAPRSGRSNVHRRIGITRRQWRKIKPELQQLQNGDSFILCLINITSASERRDHDRGNANTSATNRRLAAAEQHGPRGHHSHRTRQFIPPVPRSFLNRSSTQVERSLCLEKLPCIRANQKSSSTRPRRLARDNRLRSPKS
jgi:hypothetical protein